MDDRRPGEHEQTAYRGHATGFTAFGRAVAARGLVVVGIWALLVVAGVLLVPRFESRLTGPPLLVVGSDSARAQEILETRFAQPFAEQDLVVFESDTLTAQDPAYRAVVDKAMAAVEQAPGVIGVISPYDPRAQQQVSENASVAAGVVRLNGTGPELQALIPTLTALAQAAATDDVHVYLTGSSPLIVDLVAQEQEDLARAERLGLPAALLVLLIASGTVVAAGLPIVLAMVGALVAFGVLGAATSFTTFNLFVPNIATMIGLGVGIDYSLLVVTRYREELATGLEPGDAVGVAIGTAGKTVFASATTVLLSLAGLLLVDAQLFRELAVGAIIAVAVMAVAALTLLPALLGLLGRRVESLRLPRLRPRGSGDIFWFHWAQRIMRHPGWWAMGVIIVLAVLASPITRLNLSLDTGTNDVGPRSAGVGREILEREFNAGRLSPMEVVYVSQDGPLDDRDLDNIARLSDELAKDWAVADVLSVTRLLDQFAGNHRAATLDLAARTPQAVAALSSLVNFGDGQNVAVISATPRWSPDTPGPINLVQRTRNEMIPRIVHDADAEVVVGGLSAQIVDITHESQRKLPVVGAAIVALSFVFLTLVFRSLVLPLKAILMNGLGIAAAYGLLVVIFQEGAGERLFDFQSTGATQVYLPLLSFAVLFGLSMDYEVFLLGRMKEEWDRTGDNRLAVGYGLQHSAGVITSAAAIMVVVFSAFTFARLREVKELGFSLAAAVLIDATLVRLILAPAAMQLLGHWNWWLPAWLDRRLPHIDILEPEPELSAHPESAADAELERAGIE
ncbi:MAG: MMPL family transporter [Thermomicrobiales bacterium]|nr:MMPL family transporter [Thermomicrobiales bacterium]